MPEFRTRPDGTVYPLTPKKSKGGGLVALGVIALLLIGGAGGFDTLVSNEGADIVTAKREASQGHHAQSWAKLGWQRIAHATRNDGECAGHSYGQVRDFFERTPCESLDRALVALHDAQNTIVIMIAWVHMSSSTMAQKFKVLDDTDGTGNVLPLSTTVGGVSGFRFDGKYYDSDRRGTTTVIAEAAAARGQPDGSALVDAAQVAAAFPPP